MQGQRLGKLTVALVMLCLSAMGLVSHGSQLSQKPRSTTAGHTVPTEQQTAPADNVHPRVPKGSGFISAGPLAPRKLPILVNRAASIFRGTVMTADYVGEGVLTVERDPAGYGEKVLQFSASIQGELRPDQYEVAVFTVGFQVSATLKGPEVQPGTTVSVNSYLPHMGPPWARFQAQQHGLLLLDANDNLADMLYPFLPIAPGASAVSTDLRALDAVGQYFLLSLRPDASLVTLESCLDGVLDLGIAADAIESLRVLAASGDPGVRGIGLRGLVEINDAQSVPDAVAYLLSGTSVPAMPQVPGRLGVAIGKLDDPTLAQAVVPLLSSPSSVQRDWALQALRRMKNPAAIPALVGALADPDQSIQYGAMMGLAETTGRENAEWATSWPKFQENPAYYVDKWLNWWETEGEAAYGATGHTPSTGG